MKSADRRESQNRVTQAARRLKKLLEIKHSANLSTVDISYYRNILILLEREINITRNCGDTGPYITILLDQLQPVIDKLFDCEMAFIKQEQSKINHRIELTRACREFSEAIESTGIVMISRLGDRLAFTFSGFLRYNWLRFIGRDITASYIVSTNYDIESLSRLFLTAKKRIEEKL